MKLTNIRTKDNKILSQQKLEELGSVLVTVLAKHGYITEWKFLTSTSIKLGYNKSSFRINTSLLGYNTRSNSLGKKIRTNIPSWSQRVEYNNLVNDVLDFFGYSANVYNSVFHIRKAYRRYNEYHWLKTKPEWMVINEFKGFTVEKGWSLS